MKSFKQFLSESVNIAGDFNGNLYMNSPTQEQEEVGENFAADILYQGSIRRLTLNTKSGIPSNQELAEHLQDDYPGCIVQSVYTLDTSNNPYKVKDSKRYHPSKLDWV
jgi:hypothetical protein